MKLNSRGQMTIELVLMTIVLVSMAVFISREFRNNELFANLANGPAVKLSGMIENGVWGSVEATRALHPSSAERLSTVEGEVFP